MNELHFQSKSRDSRETCEEHVRAGARAAEFSTRPRVKELSRKESLAMSTYQRRGAGAVGIIVGIVAVVLVALGALYLFSDVFKSGVNEQVNQIKNWTPENIANNPKGYLDFCQQQTEAALKGLKADEIRLAQTKGRLEQMRDDAAKQVSAGEKVLKEIVPQYVAQKDSAEVKVTWGEKTLNKDQARKQISQLDRDVERQKSLKAKAEGGLRKLETEQSKLDDLRSKAKEQLAEIDYNRQLLAANKLSEDLKTRLVNMQAAVNATVSAAASTSDGTKSLSEITAESGGAAAVDDKSLEDTLSKYK